MAKNENDNKLERFEIFEVELMDVNNNPILVKLLFMMLSGEGDTNTLDTIKKNGEKIKDEGTEYLLVDGQRHPVIKWHQLLPKSIGVSVALRTIKQTLVVNLDEADVTGVSGLGAMISRAMKTHLIPHDGAGAMHTKSLALLETNNSRLHQIAKLYLSGNFDKNATLVVNLLVDDSEVIPEPEESSDEDSQPAEAN